MADSRMDGSVVVITGATSGFGRGAALRYAKAGATVVLAARRDAVLDEVARLCDEAGGRGISVPTDVSHQEEVDALCEAALSKCGKIDVWINNAGAAALGLFDEVPLADHVQVIQTDLLGTLYGCYAALRHFIARGKGILINVSSALGKMPAPYYASYTAAKHGVCGLSAALRQEISLRKLRDIHVCTVMPASHDTPFFQHAANYTGHQPVPIKPLYEPGQVIDVLFALALEPKDEVPVGTAGALLGSLGERMMPHLTETLMEKNVHSTIENAKPAEETRGSLHQPTMEGTEVEGGWKKA